MSPIFTLVSAVSSMRLNSSGRSAPCPVMSPVSRRTLKLGRVVESSSRTCSTSWFRLVVTPATRGVVVVVVDIGVVVVVVVVVLVDVVESSGRPLGAVTGVVDDVVDDASVSSTRLSTCACTAELRIGDEHHDAADRDTPW